MHTKLQQLITLTNVFAAICHDLGKSTTTFQEKMVDNKKIGLDVMRHERLSVVILFSLYRELFNAKYLPKGGDDKELFSVLSTLDIDVLRDLFNKAIQDVNLKQSYGKAKNDLNNAMKPDLLNKNKGMAVIYAAFYLILSHHHLPEASDGNITEQGYVNERHANDEIVISEAPPFYAEIWLLELKSVCKELSQCDFNSAYHKIDAFVAGVTYIARPSFIIADQNISAQSEQRKAPALTYANTYADKNGVRHLAQPLINHLIDVAKETQRLTERQFKEIEQATLPSMQSSPDALKARTDIDDFKWQNNALDVAEQQSTTGNINLISAETGKGKTRGNIKIVSANRNHTNVRATVCLGTNSLTKQTALEYINDIGVGQYTTAITGHALTRHFIDTESATGRDNLNVDDVDMNEMEVQKKDWASLLDADFSCSFKPKYDKILATPIVVSTIDHIVECIQSPKSTASRLLQRLQTSDLIIDEIDSYSETSLIPIYKLVYLAGLYNRNVVVSSATQRPTIADSIVEAFDAGLNAHNAIFDKSELVSGAVINDKESATISAFSTESFYDVIERQRKELLSLLSNVDARRKAEFCDIKSTSDFIDTAKMLHERHHVNVNEFNLSAGVIRFNNVKYVQNFAKEIGRIQDNDVEIGVIAYHSRIAAPIRYRVEKCLDSILKRKKHDKFVDTLNDEPEFKQTLEKARIRGVKNIIIMVVCSPIEETGRDHDFDWAITEPCSNHSLIQLVGRVLRHRRSMTVDVANVVIMKQSLRVLYEPELAHRPVLPAPITEHLTLLDGVDVQSSFTEEDYAYTEFINAKACFIDYKQTAQKVAEFQSINALETQKVVNAASHSHQFICTPHVHLSVEHARKFPLREKSNDTNIWYDGDKFVMFNNEQGKQANIITCNFKINNEKIDNLYFNDDIDAVIASIDADDKLYQLLCSKFSTFSITPMQLKTMRKLNFSSALGLM